MLRLGCVIGLLLRSTASWSEPRMETLQSEVRPGDSLELDLQSGTTLTGEIARYLDPEDAVLFRVWNSEDSRYSNENIRLAEVDRCVRLRTEGNMLVPIAGAVLMGAAGAGLGVAFNNSLGDDAPENAAEIVLPFAFVGMLVGTIVGALIMPDREERKTLWPR
jgi:hypothetical protein